MERAATDAGQHLVVRGRVATEILLDARELRDQDPFAREHQCLQCARHSPVPIAERVDHRQVEVRHRGLHHRRHLGLRVEFLDEVAHE